jgi:hypothetical protein
MDVLSKTASRPVGSYIAANRFALGARAVLMACVLFAGSSRASDQPELELTGHVKSRISIRAFPDDSIFNDLAGSGASDFDNSLRINFRIDQGTWAVDAAAQVIALYGDTVEYSRGVPGLESSLLLPGRLPSDERRGWDLTQVNYDEGRTAVISRLDRLALGYSGPSLTLNFGRQALSWGNGLFYSPMDIVNPFDPTQVDTEYKAGDDMLYGQFLKASGNDYEAAYVFRRNPETGDLDSGESTVAIKYHGLSGAVEYDLMIADHYDETLVAVGGSLDAIGAAWRGDLVLSDTTTEGVTSQLVINSSYSWTWSGKNVTGSLEYFHNGFGQDDGCYSPACLGDNPELVERVSRGQLFTLGRHYLGGSMTIEVTPLHNLTPNLFWNMSDGSALFQLVSSTSLGDNLVLLGALGLPMGPDGTEFGGIESPVPGKSFSSDASLFVQLGWYF